MTSRLRSSLFRINKALTSHASLSTPATQATANWLRAVVVAQGFCPFAKAPVQLDQVLITSSQGSSSAVLATLEACLLELASHTRYETALIVLEEPFGTSLDFRIFSDFLVLLDEAAELCSRLHADSFSLASFHPDYQFAGIATESVIHAIHRSPFPTLHVLRESSLDRVREAYGQDTSVITDRNESHAEELGHDFFRKFYRLKT